MFPPDKKEENQMRDFILVSLGGFFGAISRFAISQFTSKHINMGFPFATFSVNLIGSFLLGVMMGAKVTGFSYALLGIGFMGAFTTFSTFNVELFKLKEEGNNRLFYIYLLLSYIGGIGLAGIGFYLGQTAAL